MTPSPAHRLTTTSLHAAINAVWPVERWDQVWTVLGCSGGADSVALVRAMHGMSRQRRLVIAHYDHGLRGRQSRADAEFVQQLAANLGLEFRLGRRDTEGANRESEFASDEQSLRTLRYDFLVRVARQHGARYVSVAHNRDDSVESVLHALLRGTGPAGLCGIPMFRDLSGSDQSTQDSDLILARPLLNIGGEQLRQWLTDQEYHHREDSSNQDTHYTRNWIRHRLLPTIIERFPSAIESVDRAISLQRDWAEVVGEQRDAFAAAHVLRVDYDGESQFVIQCTRAYPAAV
ncbi:MAG: tRNA lysidine(34) synthetase TilS, partial [Planctomycetota bacterium]